jgi:hypothetical protein
MSEHGSGTSRILD